MLWRGLGVGGGVWVWVACVVSVLVVGVFAVVVWKGLSQMRLVIGRRARAVTIGWCSNGARRCLLGCGSARRPIQQTSPTVA